MGKFKVLLWDIDGTLLDFHAAEAAAIRTLFQKYGFGICSDEMLRDYSGINTGWWKRLELGEVTKKQVLLGRFLDFFWKYELDPAQAEAFNADYQLALGDTICFCPNALETVQALKGQVLQCAVTNGTLIAQKKKLAASGLDQILDKLFISDVIGIEKPNLGFFQAVFDQIGIFSPDDVMIIGDSLTSDIQGGMNAGICTCWYNPTGSPAPDKYHIDYEIHDLSQVCTLCGL